MCSIYMDLDVSNSHVYRDASLADRRVRVFIFRRDDVEKTRFDLQVDQYRVLDSVLWSSKCDTCVYCD